MNKNKCIQLDHGTLKEHSTLNVSRVGFSVVATKNATFVFGGLHSRDTYEYLPKDSSIWLIGKTKIPRGFYEGSAISVKSDHEIWLIGGLDTERRILSFNVKEHTFQVLPAKLFVDRWGGHQCAFIPNTSKIMITGGWRSDRAEIIDTEDGTVAMTNSMNFQRRFHGMGIVTINGKDRLAAFGGYDTEIYLDSLELYNTKTAEWETSSIKLSDKKASFAFLSVKFKDVNLML